MVWTQIGRHRNGVAFAYARTALSVSTRLRKPGCCYHRTSHGGGSGILPETGGTGKYWVVTWTAAA